MQGNSRAGLVLDIGCGSYCRGDVGLDIDFSWSNPYHDPSQYDEIAGPRRENCDLVQADANYPLPFRDECFDKVVIVHVLEHLLSPYHTLLEVKRVLRKGGELIVIAPNAKENPADWLDEGHLYSFTEPTIKRLVSKLFCVVTLKTVNNKMDVAIVARKST